MENQTLIPLQQKEVIFYEDTLTIVLVQMEDGAQLFVPVRPICENLGVDWSGQRQRINLDPVLSKWVRFVGITPTNRGIHVKRTPQPQGVTKMVTPLESMW